MHLLPYLGNVPHRSVQLIFERVLMGKRFPNLWRVGPLYDHRSDALIVEDETWFGEQKKLFWVAATDMLQLWSHSLF